MTLHTPTYYSVSCDADGCTRSTDDGHSDYSAWADESGALEDWWNNDGVVMDDGRHYCDEHAPRCADHSLRLEPDGTCEDCPDPSDAA